MPINIIVYHYVRNNEDFDYFTYSRRKEEFELQIDYFTKTSSIINPNDSEKINYFLKSDDEYCYLLTFDDGYKDHLYCAEYLYSREISAFFFPPINAINNSLLDVNAIHILIGSKELKVQRLIEEIKEICFYSKLNLYLNNQKVDIKTYLENFNTKNVINFKVNLS